MTIETIKSQVPALDKFIKKLDIAAAGQRPEIVDHVVVKYDRARGSAEKLEGKRFSLAGLFGLNKKADYYRVDSFDRAAVNFTDEYRLKVPEYGTLDFSIRFVVSVLDRSETKVVEALARRNDPAAILQNHIAVWIRELTAGQHANPFKDFESFAAGLRQGLSNRGRTVGLRMEILVTEPGSGESRPAGFMVNVPDIPVQPKDFNDRLYLSFEAMIVPDPQQTDTIVKAGYRQKDNFKPLLQQWLQSYIRDTVNYNTLNSGLHFGVRSDLLAYWNGELRKLNTGWMVADLTMQNKETLPEEFRVEKMEIEVALRNVKIPLSNTVILNLSDAEKFRNKRVPDLEVWTREKLRQSAQNRLSQVSYAELISDIDSIGDDIKGDLNVAAREIGYRVEYFLTSELVDHSRLNFNFQFENDEQAYQTSLNEPVKLNILFNGRIKSLNHYSWKKMLLPDTDFVAEMKKVLLPEVRKMLLTTQADDFYTRFYETVASALETRLRDKLVADFNVDPDVDILPQMVESDLGNLIKQLQKGIHEITVVCFEGNASFRVTFSIASVDPSKWTLFANRNYANAEEVKRDVGERIRIFTENAVRVMVKDFDLSRDPRFFGLIQKYARDADRVVREKLGLVIDIIDVEQLTNKLAGLINSKRIQGTLNMVEKLMDVIQDIDLKIVGAMNSDDDFEVPELKARRDRMQDMLNQNNFGGPGLPEGPGGTKLDELMGSPADRKLLGLPDEGPSTND